MSVRVPAAPRVVVTPSQPTRLVLAPPGGRLQVAAVGPQGRSGSDWQTFVFTQPSLTWRVVHNRNGARYMATVRSETGEVQLVAPRNINGNEFVIDFDEPLAGSVEVSFEVLRR